MERAEFFPLRSDKRVLRPIYLLIYLAWAATRSRKFRRERARLGVTTRTTRVKYLVARSFPWVVVVQRNDRMRDGDSRRDHSCRQLRCAEEKVGRDKELSGSRRDSLRPFTKAV